MDQRPTTTTTTTTMEQQVDRKVPDEKTKPTVLITGITGQQGMGVTDYLYSTQRYRLRALVKNINDEKSEHCRKTFPNIQLVEGDLNIPSSLSKAVNGCDFAYLVTDYRDYFDEEKEVTCGKNFLNACKEGGIKHVILSSSPSSSISSGILSHGIKVPPFDSKAAIETYLRSLKINFTVLHFSFYWENLITLFKPLKDPRDGKWRLTLPMSDKPLGGVGVRDGGKVVAMILENPTNFNEKVISVCSEMLKGTDLAQTMTTVLGNTIEYHPIPAEDFGNLNIFGANEDAAMFRFYQSYGNKIWHPTETQKLIKLQSFEEWCREHSRCWVLA
jgi:uncharacterized protein YbjT (DUF2867 family)